MQLPTTLEKRLVVISMILNVIIAVDRETEALPFPNLTAVDHLISLL